MSDAPRILIITAAFGEGHNSAARNLGLALGSAGAVVRVADPCLLGAPRSTGFICACYRIITTRMPKLWAWIYRSTDRCDFSDKRSPILRWPEHALAKLLDEFQPTAVVSTYPVYPYFMARIRPEMPVFIVVTDSIEINSAWLRAPGKFWLVTDPATRDAMTQKGLIVQKIIDTGFPVHPVFSQLEPVDALDVCAPFRVLYFPTAQLPLLRRHARELLETSPAIRLTIVMGRNVRRLHREARKIKDAYPGRVRLIGWTRRVPQLLNRHHLVIGKAGGATVHEAIAARCPMMIHHLVPGQEEGNLQLLESIGAGLLADSPGEMGRQLARLLEKDALAWRTMKTALAHHNRSTGATTSASFILDQISTYPSIS